MFQQGFELFQFVRFRSYCLTSLKINIVNFFMLLPTNMNLIEQLNQLPLNTEGTASLYASYLKKFALFVGQSDDSVYVSKEFYNDENICAFLLKYYNEKEHKPHFKKAILAALGSALVYHNLPGIFSSLGVYPLTLRMKKVTNSYFLLIF